MESTEHTEKFFFKNVQSLMVVFVPCSSVDSVANSDESLNSGKTK